MKTLKAAVIGTGYIGPAHIEAVRRIGGAEVVAVAEASQDLAEKKAELLGIPRAYGDYKKMIEREKPDIVDNCTPNPLHYKVNCDILKAGIHVISEKPLRMNTRESSALVKLAQKTGLVNAVNFNYRYYPLVQHASMMVRNNELGRVFAVQGTYIQDWLLYVTDWNWRIEPKFAGESRAMGDIGSHWFDLLRFLLDRKIIRVCADLLTVHETRKKPKANVETFSGKTLKPSQYELQKITSEDHGHVLVEFEGGVKGMVVVSQVSAGRKTHSVFEIYGTEKGNWWDHERPNEMMIGRRNEPNQLLFKDPVLIDPAVRDTAHYPAGHNEGYPTCVKNFCRNVYRHIRDPKRKIDYATFEDGHNANAVVAAVLKSHQSRKWVDVKY